MTSEDDIKQIREIVEALQRSMRRHDRGEPVVDIPPVVAIPEPRLRGIVEEIVERTLGATEARILDKVKDVVHAEVEDVMSRIGLRIDDDHMDETSDAVRGLLRFHKRADRIVGHIVMTFLASLFFGLLALLGYNVKSGAGH